MSRAAPQYLNMEETLETVGNFIEVTIHYILYLRQVYPPDIFERRRKYGVPVWRSRHEGLNQYIASFITQFMSEFAKGKVERLTIAVTNAATRQPLEQFALAFGWLGDFDPAEYVREADRKRRPPAGVTAAQVELQLRKFLINLSAKESELLELPSELSFSLFIDLRDDVDPPVTRDEHDHSPAPWVPGTTADASLEHLVHDARLGLASVYLTVDETEVKGDWLNREQRAGRLQGSGSTDTSTSARR